MDGEAVLDAIQPFAENFDRETRAWESISPTSMLNVDQRSCWVQWKVSKKWPNSWTVSGLRLFLWPRCGGGSHLGGKRP